MEVYAHYGLWDRTPRIGTPPPPFVRFGGNWVKWKDGGHNPDNIIFEDWKRDTCCATDYPMIGTYDLGDPEVHRWNIRLAKAAGVKAFWAEPLPYQGLTDYIYQVAFRNLMLVAEQEGFKVAILFWGGASHDGDQNLIISQVIASLREWKDSPAYLRIDGKPVYVLNRLRRWPAYGWFTFDDMTRLKQEVEAAIGEEVYWIYENEVWEIYKESFPEHWWSHPAIDAFHLYIGYHDNGYQFGNFTPETWRKEMAYCRDKAHQYGKKFYHPLTPGFDNRNFGGTDYVPREGGAVAQRQIDAMLDLNVDGAFLCNWNDWGESTEFMPSLTYWNDWTTPYQYLELVTQLTGKTFRIPQYQPVETIDPVFQQKFLELIAEYPPTPTSLGPLVILAGLYYLFK